jgi:hypothetical protein
MLKDIETPRKLQTADKKGNYRKNPILTLAAKASAKAETAERTGGRTRATLRLAPLPSNGVIM